MNIQLRDNGSLLNTNLGFLFNSYATNINCNPNMMYIDERGGVAERNYQIWLAPYTTDNNLSYHPSFGQASMIITEVI